MKNTKIRKWLVFTLLLVSITISCKNESLSTSPQSGIDEENTSVTTLSFKSLNVQDFKSKGIWHHDAEGFNSSDGLLFIDNTRDEYTIIITAFLDSGSNGGYGILFETYLNEDNSDSGYSLQFDRGIGDGSIIIRPRIDGREGNYFQNFVFNHTNCSGTILNKNLPEGIIWWVSVHKLKLDIKRHNSDQKKLSLFINNKMVFENFYFDAKNDERKKYIGLRSWHVRTTYISMEIR